MSSPSTVPAFAASIRGLAVSLIAPDGPASLIVLQPRPRVPPGSGPASVVAPPRDESSEADELSVDAVFIDGREPPPAKR